MSNGGSSTAASQRHADPRLEIRGRRSPTERRYGATLRSDATERRYGATLRSDATGRRYGATLRGDATERRYGATLRPTGGENQPAAVGGFMFTFTSRNEEKRNDGCVMNIINVYTCGSRMNPAEKDYNYTATIKLLITLRSGNKERTL
ncbi:hypothetical protein EYF80_056760 [Liparis tanakae]|uniref:Uncharacterized protein n=1 Tax=Liparis tanakae TaxID=230148 RepID=A0A4Z2EWA0_9TELE|nr:hypothetical protein EYF80_056760 [Liparis tanakae]